MFGNRAKISAEELAYMKEQLDNDRGFFENVNAKSKLIEADFDELEKSRQLEESSLKQLNDNANNVVEFSKDSMDAISALNDSFTECVKATTFTPSPPSCAPSSDGLRRFRKGDGGFHRERKALRRGDHFSAVRFSACHRRRSPRSPHAAFPGRRKPLI